MRTKTAPRGRQRRRGTARTRRVPPAVQPGRAASGLYCAASARAGDAQAFERVLSEDTKPREAFRKLTARFVRSGLRAGGGGAMG